MYEGLLLQSLHEAKAAHLQWVRRAKHLVENLPVSEDMIPVDSTECAFGHWLHADGFRLKVLEGFEKTIEEIEELHTQLHDVYINIYKIYFVETKRPWPLKAIFGERKEVPPSKQEEAHRHFDRLEDISHALVKKIERLERQLKLAKSEDIAAIFR